MTDHSQQRRCYLNWKLTFRYWPGSPLRMRYYTMSCHTSSVAVEHHSFLPVHPHFHTSRPHDALRHARAAAEHHDRALHHLALALRMLGVTSVTTRLRRAPSQWRVSCVVVCAFLLLTHLTVPISFHLSISACSLDPPSPFPPVGASDPHFESPPPFESSPCMIHHPYTHYFGSNAHGQPHREKRIVPSLIRGRGSL